RLDEPHKCELRTSPMKTPTAAPTSTNSTRRARRLILRDRATVTSDAARGCTTSRSIGGGGDGGGGAVGIGEECCPVAAFTGRSGVIVSSSSSDSAASVAASWRRAGCHCACRQSKLSSYACADHSLSL